MPKMPPQTVIRFIAPVDGETVNALFSHVDSLLAEGHRTIRLLISSPGGSVFHGLSVYNYLKGIPAEIITHNFGSVDSIGVIIYCAGKRRISVPHARFLLHGVSAGFEANLRLEEKQIEERLKGLRIDTLNIARVLSANAGVSEADAVSAMRDRTTLDPVQAKEWGLVHEISTELFPAGSRVVSIQK